MAEEKLKDKKITKVDSKKDSNENNPKTVKSVKKEKSVKAKKYFLPLKDAVTQLKKSSEVNKRKFIESVDICVSLGIDPKQTDQNIRGSLLLPSGSGKKLRIIVFCEGEDNVKKSLAKGAKFAGLEDLITKIEGGFLDFDYCIATPVAMKKIGKVAKILGPRGLMPNVKNGNISEDLEKVIDEALRGKVNFKNEKGGLVHSLIGKINFSEDDIIKNFEAFIECIKSLKPENAKGKYIKDVYISTTMGPAVKVNFEGNNI